MQMFHAETSTFHLSCREYAILPLDWIAVLGIRFGGYPILTDDMSFKMVCELLGIPPSLTMDTREDILGLPRRHRSALSGCKVASPRVWHLLTFIFGGSSCVFSVVASLATTI